MTSPPEQERGRASFRVGKEANTSVAAEVGCDICLFARHVAILEYLRDLGGGYSKSAEAFAADAGLAGEAVPSGTALLEKKW